MNCISSHCLPKQTSCPVNCFYLLFYDSDEVNGQCIDKIPLSGRSEGHYLGRFSTNTQVFFSLFKLFPAYSTMTTILHQCPLWFAESDLSITASEIPVYLLSKLLAHFDPALIFYLHFSNTKFLIFLFYWSLYISELPNILIFRISRPTHVFEQRVRINPFFSRVINSHTRRE